MQQLRPRGGVLRSPAPRQEDGAPQPRSWTLKKQEVVRMLMAMDRYRVDSVVLRAGDPGPIGWEIAASKRGR